MSNLLATPTSASRVELTWQDNSNNETEFRIEMKCGPAAPSFTDIGSVPANNTGVGVSGLDPSTSYDFRVRARSGSGNSGYSNTPRRPASAARPGRASPTRRRCASTATCP